MKPQFLDETDGSPEYNARDFRRNFAALATSGPDAFTARAGLTPRGGLSSAVSLSGTTWTVHPCVATVDLGVPLVGAYQVAIDATTGSTAPANVSGTRTDLLAVRVRDDSEDMSGQKDAAVVYLEGVSAAPDGHLPLARVSVPASGDPTLTAVYPLTVAAGGVTPVRDAPELPEAPYPGQTVWDDTLGMMLLWDGSGWRPASDVCHLAGVTPPSGEPIGSTGMSLWVPARLRGMFRAYRIIFQGGITSSTSGARGVIMRVNGISASEYRSASELRRNGTVIRSTSGDGTALAPIGLVDAPASLVETTITPRSKGSTGTVTYSSHGYSNGVAGSGTVSAGGRWTGSNLTPERFTLRSESTMDEWASSTRADLYGIV